MKIKVFLSKTIIFLKKLINKILIKKNKFYKKKNKKIGKEKKNQKIIEYLFKNIYNKSLLSKYSIF